MFKSDISKDLLSISSSKIFLRALVSLSSSSVGVLRLLYIDLEYHVMLIATSILRSIVNLSS